MSYFERPDEDVLIVGREERIDFPFTRKEVNSGKTWAYFWRLSSSKSSLVKKYFKRDVSTWRRNRDYIINWPFYQIKYLLWEL